MQNLENYKDKTLQDAARDYMEECGLALGHIWTKDDWVCFADWIFKEKIFKWEVAYLVRGNSYVQKYILDAPNEAKAKEVFDREVPGVQRVLGLIH